MRTHYFRAATTRLSGPHFTTNLYLPGSEHASPLNTDPSLSCVEGLYFTSHRRVAARWGPVVLTVEVGGQQVRTDDTVRPTHVPSGVVSGTYRKYRTDSMRITDIIGVTGYSAFGGDYGAKAQAQRHLDELNATLAAHKAGQVVFTGEVLERLRTSIDGEGQQFVLFGVKLVPADSTRFTVTITTEVQAADRTEAWSQVWDKISDHTLRIGDVESIDAELKVDQ